MGGLWVGSFSLLVPATPLGGRSVEPPPFGLCAPIPLSLSPLIPFVVLIIEAGDGPALDDDGGLVGLMKLHWRFAWESDESHVYLLLGPFRLAEVKLMGKVYAAGLSARLQLFDALPSLSQPPLRKHLPVAPLSRLGQVLVA